jgi:S1-C subfamily serine protease
MRLTLSAALAALLLIAPLCLAQALFPARAQADPAQASSSARADSLRETPVVRAVKAVAPAVVNISVARTERTFFGRRAVREGAGSGVIIDGKRALVLTNAHVVENATTIGVRLLDGRDFEAELVGSDPDFDIAVLSLKEAHDLPEIPLGDSSDLMIGEPVIAIGNPYGYSHSVTTGVISALNRSLNTQNGVFTDFIQTDAAINPGNSGGPLLNILGRLVGINSAIRLEAEGIGFAIPINKARRVIDELLAEGQVTPIWLGMYGQDLDQPTAAALGLERVAGMLVTEVVPGTPAAAAALRPGDVVQAVNSVGVADKNHYLALVRNYTRADVIKLVFARGGAQYTVSLRPQGLDPAAMLAQAAARWGIELATGSDALALDPRSGGAVVRLARPGSPAARLGLKTGDSLRQIGNMRIRSAEDFAHAFLKARMQLRVLMRVERGGRLYTARMNL